MPEQINQKHVKGRSTGLRHLTAYFREKSRISSPDCFKVLYKIACNFHSEGFEINASSFFTLPFGTKGSVQR